MELTSTARTIPHGKAHLGLTYILIQLLTFSFVGGTMSLGFGVYRLKMIISLAVTLLFLPYLVQVFNRFLSRGPRLRAVLVFLLLLQPALIQLLFRLELRQPPDGFGTLSVALSAISWIIPVVCVVVAHTTFQGRHYRKFLSVLWWIALYISLEALVVFYVLRGNGPASLALDPLGRFVGVIGLGGELGGIFGLILMTLSLVYYESRLNGQVYLLTALLGILLAVASLNRGVLVGLAVLIALLTYRYIRNARGTITFSRCVIFGSLLLAIGAAIFLSFFLLRAEASMSSLYDRFIIWARTVEVGWHFFPIGSGGGCCARYSVTQVVGKDLSQAVATLKFEGSGQLAISQSRYTTRAEAGEVPSPHSVHLQIFCEFGLLGFIITSMLLLLPLKALRQCWRLRRLGFLREARLLSIEASLLLAVQIPMALVAVGDSILWILAVIYLGLAHELAQYNPFLAARRSRSWQRGPGPTFLPQPS